MQRAMDGFYMEEMQTRVMLYIKYQMIADTQAYLSDFELGQKL